MDLAHRHNLILNVNFVSDTFPNICPHCPSINLGQIKMCLEFQNVCFTLHICLTTILARTEEGHHIHIPFGLVKTLGNQSFVLVNSHPSSWYQFEPLPFKFFCCSNVVLLSGNKVRNYSANMLSIDSSPCDKVLVPWSIICVAAIQMKWIIKFPSI